MVRSMLFRVTPVLVALAFAACGDSGSAGGADVPIDGADVDESDAPDFGVIGEDGQGGGVFAWPSAEFCDANAGTFLCPCDANADCFSGFCVPSSQGGSVCSKTCEEQCPPGWGCDPVGGGGEPTFICVERGINLCKPCGENADCQKFAKPSDRCVDMGDGLGSFCGTSCVNDTECLPGYACLGVPDVDSGTVSKQCVLQTGECTCSPSAVIEGAATPCSNGLCPGVRACTADGLTSCNAPDPEPEICDGVDNNCNGATDEDFDDTDDDGTADCVDSDDDQDTVLDVDDNCPLVANTDQADVDGDDVGDLCDPPATPTIDSTDPPSPANNNAPTVYGTGEPGTTVHLYGDTDCTDEIGTAVVDDDGAWELAVEVQDDSGTWFHVAGESVFGVLGECSEDGLLYEEVSQDTAPEILGSEPTSPANENEPTIVGVAEPGATVTLTDSEDCKGEIVGQGLADPEGQWAIPIGPVGDDTETALYATSPGACNPVPFVYIEDSTPPEGPVLTGTNPPTPNNTLAPTVLGQTEPFALVHVYEGVDCTGLELGEGAANDEGVFGAPITVAENVGTALSALAVDQAGNVGACSANPFTFVNDTVPPGPPVFTGTSPESPSATVTTPIILGSTEGNSTVAIYTNPDCTGDPVVVGQAQASGVFGIGVEAGNNTATTWWGVTTDPAGNTSGCSPEGITFVHDNLLPDPPVLSAFQPQPPSSVKTPTVTGTAEPFAKIRAYSSGACNGLIIGAGEADEAGAFAFPVIVNGNGETTVYATAEDGSGLVSDCSVEGITYVHDASVPDPPFFVGTDPASPGNTLAFDVLGQAEPGVTVTLHTDQDCLSAPVGEAVVPGTATFSISASAKSNGSVSYWGRATDGAGNLSPCSLEPATYVHDGILPAAPSVFATEPGSPAPTTTPNVIGAAEPGVTVTLHGDPGCAGQPIGTGMSDPGSGQFEIPATVAATGTTFIFAQAIDAAGNASACSSPGLAFEFDDTEPEIPAVLSTSPASPANANEPVVHGTALAGTTVFLYGDEDCAGDVLGTADAEGDGTFAIPIEVLDDTTTPIYAAAANVADIWSPCSPQPFVYVEDSQEPLAPVLLTTSPEAPSAVPNPTVVGEAEPGALIHFYLDEDCTGQVAGIGGALANGSFAIPAFVLPNKVSLIYATATDTVGNTSACSKPGLPYVHDAIPPGMPFILATDPPSPSESVTTPTVSGVADKGSVVTLYATPDCTGPSLGQQVASDDGFAIAITVDSNTATDLHANASDTAGNISACSPGKLYVHDDAVPEIPTLVGTDPASPGNTTQPTVTATAEPSATVRVFLGPDCTGFMTGSGVANANGLAEFKLLVPDNGVSTLYANATDLGGQTSDCTPTPLLYQHDGLGPLMPQLTGTTAASPSDEALPAAIGTAEPGATIQLFAGPGCGGAPISSGPVDGAGAFSVGFNAQPNASLTVTALAIDPAGNPSVCSAAIHYVHDDLPPSTPILTLTSPPSPSSYATPLLHGTSDPETTVEIYGTPNCTGVVLGSGDAHQAGTFAAVVAVPLNTVTQLHGVAIDAAGNVSPCSGGLTYEHDDNQPLVPFISASDPASPNGTSTTPLLIGNGDPNATMRIYTDADCDGQVVAEGSSDAVGDFSVQVTVLEASVNLFWVASEDLAGNTSPCSAEGFEYIHDNTPPAPPVVLSASPPSPTNATLTPKFSGTGESDELWVRLYTTVGCAGEPAAQAPVIGDLTFSHTVTVTANATTMIYADAIDEAGNVSTCTNPGFAYIHDDIPPAPPELTGTAPPSPAADASPDAVGTAEVGATVRIYGNAACGGSVLGTGVAGAGGDFSVNALVGLDAATTLYANATDAAGNTSACSPSSVTYVNDSKGPATPLLTGTDPESPSVTDTTPVVFGVTDPDVTVFLYMNGGCSGIAVDQTTSAGDGAFSFDAIVPENSLTVFYARAADEIGNLSSCSEGLPYLHDTEAPSAPIITGTTPDSPGQSATPTVEGVTEDGAAVTIHLLADCSDAPLAAGESDAEGLFAILVETINDNAGITYYAQIADTAGNISPCSAGFEYVHDTTPPGAAIITGSIPEPPSVEPEPAILGVAEPEAEVFIYDEADCSGASVGGAIADDDGDFAALADVKLNQPTELHAQAVDAAGNIGPCGPAFLYLHDTKPPNEPVITHTTPASPSNQSTSPVVHGLAEPGTTIHLFNQINCLLASAAQGVVGPDGNFAVAVPVGANKTTILRALAQDGADNKSPCSGTVNYTHDNIAPVFAGIEEVEVKNLTTVVLVWEPATDNFTNEEHMRYQVCVTTECGGCNGAAFSPTYTVTGGGLEKQVGGLSADTRYYFVVRALDQAGNTSPIPGAEEVGGDAPPAVAFKTKGSKMAIDIAVGESQTCALLSDGGLACWGDAVAPELADPIDVDLGLAHACAIRQNGGLQCWGSNSSGQLGDGTTSESVGATNVQGLTDVASVGVGLSHTCAVRANGEVLCWGLNQHGQLGDGTTELSASPVAVVFANGQPIDGAVTVTAGWNHSCVALADGSVYCWGLNTTGQIGAGGGEGSTSAVQVDVPVPVTSLTSGEAHTCALGTDGDVYCWGWNAFGQLATGDSDSQAVPWPVGLTGTATLGGGAWHVCATLIDGSARCWGRNDFGQLGTGNTQNSNVVQLVTGLQNAVNIGAGSGHTCALLSDGSVRCWGANLGGELGNGSNVDSAVPVLVTEISGEARLTHLSRSYEHGCVRVSDGGVRCWGRNDSGQIGNGEVSVEASDPHVVSIGATLAVATGAVHSCALLGNRTVRCWGGNTQGAVGTGAAGPPVTAPTPVTGLTEVVEIALGGAHSCALDVSGHVHCWGANDAGQIGTGSFGVSVAAATEVAGIDDVIAIAAGGAHTCALEGTGAVYCWGADDANQLGTAGSGDSATPAVVPGLTNVVGVVAGDRHTCARLANGQARCWGANDAGQLGDGSLAGKATPQQVIGLTSVKQLSAGVSHTCALRVDGGVLCWGSNDSSELGTGNTNPSLVPVVATAMNGPARVVAAGLASTCAIDPQGRIQCWGSNEEGFLGTGEPVDNPSGSGLECLP